MLVMQFPTIRLPVNLYLAQKLFRYTLPLLAGVVLSCKEEPYSNLPAATQEGKNTIGCYVDGQRWTPVSTDWKSGSGVTRYLARERTLLIGGGNDNKRQYILITLANFTGQPGTYRLDSLCDDLPRVCANTASFRKERAFSFNDSYWTDYQFHGTLTITKHTASFVSGTFAFTARQRTTGKVVHITDGRSDTPYITY